MKAGTFSELRSRELPEVRWWIDPILPRGGTLLTGGEAGIGKSFIALEYIRALASGTPLFGHSRILPPGPARVLYVEQELGEAGLQERIRKVFAEESAETAERCLYISKDTGIRLDSDEGIRRLRDHVYEFYPDVLVLDPVGYMMVGDENSNQAVNIIFQNLEWLKGTNPDLGIILVHHFAKPPRSQDARYDPLEAYNFRGASAWKDRPDTRQTLTRVGCSGGGWCLKTRYVTRHGRSPGELFLRVGEDLRVRYEAAEEPGANENPVQPIQYARRGRPPKQIRLNLRPINPADS